MNGNRLDDLFEQKLGNHKLTPPPGSWDKIEDNLKANQSKGIALWIKIAASFILLLTAGWLMIPAEQIAVQKQVAEIVKEVEPDLASPNNNQSKANNAPVLSTTEEDSKIKLEPADTNTSLLLAHSIDSKERDMIQINPLTKRVASKEIKMLQLEISSSDITLAGNYRHQVLPMDVSMTHTYSNERNEEVKKRRKFRMLNGIISIAKGVNKSKLGFEDIRNAKNGFVNDELKYGTKETDDVVEENDTKSDDLNK
jgi:hypothetical protein